jgi:DNA invertase Pin-like site-specific DNA recombinase
LTRIIRKIEPKMAALPKKKRVAAYCRVSTEKESMLNSLSAQVSHYSGYIQANPFWEYAGVYADEAETGTKEDRQEFQRLLADCRSGKIDLVLTKSISRFARNTLTLLSVSRELKMLSVDIWFEQENIRTISSDGEMMLSIFASCAQEESRQVSDNCKWRIRNGYEEGRIYGLNFLYGYQIRKGEIEIEPKQAEVVRFIFSEYLKGMGCKSIASFLNGKNIPAYLGGAWSEDRIIKMIRNEKYAGNALLQKKYVVDHLTKKEVKNRGTLPMYFAEGTHPAIIDLDTFTLANEKMSESRKRNQGRVAPKAHPLSGKIICPYCGCRYTRKTTHGKAAWICSRYLRYGKDACPSKRIPENILIDLAGDLDISEIRDVGEGELAFYLKSGKVVNKKWQNRSRKESWTVEMKEEARRRSLNAAGKANHKSGRG